MEINAQIRSDILLPSTCNVIIEREGMELTADVGENLSSGSQEIVYVSDADISAYNHMVQEDEEVDDIYKDLTLVDCLPLIMNMERYEKARFLSGGSMITTLRFVLLIIVQSTI